MPRDELSSLARQNRIVAQFYCEGLNALLQSGFLPADLLLPTGATPFRDIDRIAAFLNALQPRSFSNPDLLFGAMYGGIATSFAVDQDPAMVSISRRLSDASGQKAFFEESSLAFSRIEDLEHRFTEQSDHFSSLEDDALLAAVNASMTIGYRSLLGLQTGRSIFFSKINHGYWEHFLATHAKAFDKSVASGRYRNLNREALQSRYSLSGFDAAVALAIRGGILHGERIDGTSTPFRLSISFCAGEALCSRILAHALMPTSRGAMQGALSFFSSISRWPIRLGDGAEAKKLFDDNLIPDFVGRFVSDAPAVLFVVPPHLRGIALAGYKGETYKMIIPGRYAHESWRVTVPVLVGLVKKLGGLHGKIVVLTQSAVLAPVLGLALARVLAQERAEVLLRFFDLGRVLDIAVPEVVAEQAWFRKHVATSMVQSFYDSHDHVPFGVMNAMDAMR